MLRASRDAGVQRVVLTSSFAAIGYGHQPQPTPFNETDWTDLTGEGLTPYVKSKTIAERAAWDFIAREGGNLELSVVNPVGVFGPVLGPDYSTSILVVQRMMDGAMPGCPRLYFGAVDVRDVAGLHILAMTHPAAKGERFLAVAGDFLSILDIAKILKKRMGAAAKRVPTRQLPDWLVRLAAFRDPAVKHGYAGTRQSKNATSEKARRMLGWDAAIHRRCNRRHGRKPRPPRPPQRQRKQSRLKQFAKRKNVFLKVPGGGDQFQLRSSKFYR